MVAILQRKGFYNTDLTAAKFMSQRVFIEWTTLKINLPKNETWIMQYYPYQNPNLQIRNYNLSSEIMLFPNKVPFLYGNIVRVALSQNLEFYIENFNLPSHFFPHLRMYKIYKCFEKELKVSTNYSVADSIIEDLNRADIFLSTSFSENINDIFVIYL